MEEAVTKPGATMGADISSLEIDERDRRLLDLLVDLVLIAHGCKPDGTVTPPQATKRSRRPAATRR
jgi:hypothetical protein